MKEKVHKFGKNKNLVGIITQANNIDNNKPIILILNAGITHRTGPFRLHVSLSRKIANNGFTVLRLDLNNIGDSEPSRDKLSYIDRNIADIKYAMDSFAKQNITKFIVMGLCTGAVNSHRIAVKDKRVVATIALDSYGYKNWLYYFHSYKTRLLNFNRWQRLFKKKPIKIANNITSADKKLTKTPFPPQTEVKSDLQNFVTRNMQMLYIYTGDWNSYSYKKQFWHMFKGVDFKQNLQVEYFADVDHTYMLLKDRDKLIKTICIWLKLKYS
jgi:dienelactone hydrolase